MSCCLLLRQLLPSLALSRIPALAERWHTAKAKAAAGGQSQMGSAAQFEEVGLRAFNCRQLGILIVLLTCELFNIS